MKIAFIIIIGLHGLIHLLGFFKAYGLSEIKELTQPISKPFGVLWLVAFLLFTFAVLLYVFKNNYWWILGFVAVLISQILIIYFWKDARFGTIPNVIILLVSVVAYANYNFIKTVDAEVTHMLSQIDPKATKVITSEMIADLPIPVKNWLSNSGIIGKENIHSVFLKQKALMKMKPEQKDWLEAEAEQYFITQTPAFIWTVNMQMMPLIDVVGRDKFKNGKGEMLIKILSLLPVVNSKDNEKINISTLQRYLAEIVWFPSAALSPNITWEKIDDFSAKATMTYEGTTGSGIFYFDENGIFKKFTTMRYMSSEEDIQLREWIIEVNESKMMNGINIPVKMNATWKLDKGDWTWLQLELTEITYNLERKTTANKK